MVTASSGLVTAPGSDPHLSRPRNNTDALSDCSEECYMQGYEIIHKIYTEVIRKLTSRQRKIIPSTSLIWDPSWKTASSSEVPITGRTLICWSESKRGHKHARRAGDRLRELCLLAWRRMHRDLRDSSRPLKGLQKSWKDTFDKNMEWYDKGECLQIIKGRYYISYMEEIFHLWMASHWDWLPRETVETPPLEVFRSRLVRTWSNLV